jgi:hypothetical protein
MSNANTSWESRPQTIWERADEPSYVRRQTEPTGEVTTLPKISADHSLVGTGGHLAVLGASAEFAGETEIRSID